MLTRKQFRAIWREMARSESGRADSERIRQLIVDAGLLAVRRLPNVLSSYNGTSIPWDVRRAAEDEAAERLCRQWASTNAPELLGGAVHR